MNDEKDQEKPVPEKPVQDQSSENKQLFVDPDDESGQVRYE